MQMQRLPPLRVPDLAEPIGFERISWTDPFGSTLEHP
jgi:hypothetical protein